MENSSNRNDRLHKENEEKRRKLEEEFGPSCWNNTEINLPPEIENQFLDHIMAFEKGWKDAKRITYIRVFGLSPNFAR